MRNEFWLIKSLIFYNGTDGDFQYNDNINELFTLQFMFISILQIVSPSTNYGLNSLAFLQN